MNKFTFLLSLSAFFATVSFAQTPAPQAVGVVTRVDGLVTVGQNNTLGNAFKDGVIQQNARVVTTGTGSTTITLNNGCVIPLNPNQAVTINSRLGCREILASIESTGAVGASGTGGVGTVSVGNAVIAVTGALTVVSVIRAISETNQRLSGS